MVYYSREMEEKDEVLEECPVRHRCVAGQFVDDMCPSYRGCTVYDGLPAIICISEAGGYVIPCPKCGGTSHFKKQQTDLENWLCKSCLLYVIPAHVQTKFPHFGYCMVVRCQCGTESYVIKDPDYPLEDLTWKCPHCQRTSQVLDIMDNPDKEKGI